MYVENPTQWGAKHICQECAAKYYDLNRTPIVCPKCRTEFIEPPKAKSSSSSARGASWRSRQAATDSGASAWTRGPGGSHSPFADKAPAADKEDGGAEAESDEDESDKSKSEGGEDSENEGKE